MSFVASSVVYPTSDTVSVAYQCVSMAFFTAGSGKCKRVSKLYVHPGFGTRILIQPESWDTNFFVARGEVTWIVPIDEDGRSRRAGEAPFPGLRLHSSQVSTLLTGLNGQTLCVIRALVSFGIAVTDLTTTVSSGTRQKGHHIPPLENQKQRWESFRGGEAACKPRPDIHHNLLRVYGST